MQQNQKVLLLGATGDIGKTILIKLLERKIPVLAVKNKNNERTRYNPLIDNVEMIQADLQNDRGIRRLLKKTDKFEPNIIINAMGVCSFAKFEHALKNDILNAVQINFLSPCLIIRHIVGNMKKSDRLKILNLSSFASTVNPPGLSIYSSTKLALENLIQQIQQESLGKIDACNLILGPVESQMLRDILEKKTNSFFEKSVQKSMKRKLQKVSPLNPESVAQIVLDLLESKPWITRCIPNRELMREISESRIKIKALEGIYEPSDTF